MCVHRSWCLSCWLWWWHLPSVRQKSNSGDSTVPKLNDLQPCTICIFCCWSYWSCLFMFWSENRESFLTFSQFPSVLYVWLHSIIHSCCILTGVFAHCRRWFTHCTVFFLFFLWYWHKPLSFGRCGAVWLLSSISASPWCTHLHFHPEIQGDSYNLRALPTRGSINESISPLFQPPKYSRWIIKNTYIVDMLKGWPSACLNC